jgi:hypothetical protein
MSRCTRVETERGRSCALGDVRILTSEFAAGETCTRARSHATKSMCGRRKALALLRALHGEYAGGERL